MSSLARRRNRARRSALESLELRTLLTASAIDLGGINGTNGAVFYGLDGKLDANDFYADRAGSALSPAGDVNGDGFDDFLIGAFGSSGVNNLSQNAGEAYLVFGKADWTATPDPDLSSPDGITFVTLYGAAGDWAAEDVSAAGDVNNDGFDDFLISSQRDRAYLVFGKADWSATPTISLPTLNGTTGVLFQSVDASDQAGASVSAAGDVNNDGFDDFLIGATSADGISNSASATGEAYLIFGKADWSSTPTFNLSSLNGTNGVTFYGIDQSDGAGSKLSAAGDVNGDGFADFLISGGAGDGPTNSSPSQGETYLIFGKSNWSATPSVLLSSLNGTGGVIIYGVDAGDTTGGINLSAAGDFNNDGYDDIIIGVGHGDGQGNALLNSGEAYVVFGKADWSATPTLLLSSLNGLNGVTFYGVSKQDYAGTSVSAAGDFNHDGFDDIIIGTTENYGFTYVVFGKADWSLTPVVNLAGINGANGITFKGIGYADHAGAAVSNAGDVNGDGISDILIGAPNAQGRDNSTSGRGDTYLVFGFQSSPRTQIGVRRGAQFYQDLNNSFTHNSGDRTLSFGNPTDLPLVGDWNNDGIDEIGIFRNGYWYLDLNGNNVWDGNSGGDVVFSFGNPTDTPLIGDWNGDGISDVGVKRGDAYYLDANGNRAWNGTAGGDSLFHFGNAADSPVVGDWSGNGRDKIGVFRNGTFYLDQNGNGAWNDTAGGDARFGYGMAGDKPIIGDWNGDGISDVGILRGNVWYLDQNGNRAWNGTLGGDALFTYGNPTDTPLVGNWTAPSPGPKPKSNPDAKTASPTQLDTLFAQLAPPAKKPD